MALPPWLVARALVGVALLLSVVVRAGTDPTREPVGTSHHLGLLSWDASWYLRIADGGYDALPQEALRFFPTLPLGVRALGSVLGSDEVALLLIVNVAALAFGMVLHRFVRDEVGDDALAARSVWLATLAPVAFVLVMGYSEALAGVATIGAIWGARRGRWGTAAAAAVVAGALRPSGAFLVVPLAIEAGRGWRTSSPRERSSRLAAVVGPVVGTLPYLLWVDAVHGDWRLPYDLQKVDGLRGDTVFPGASLPEALSGLDGSDLVDGMRALWVFVFLGLLIVSARRLPGSLTAFAAVTLVVATATEHIGSVERYAFGAFPLVIAASTLTARPLVERVLLVTCTSLMAGLALLAFLDLYVP